MPVGGPTVGHGNTAASQGSSSVSNDRRQTSSEGPTAQSASVTRAITPADFQRMYRQNGNMLTGPTGQQYVMFSGEFPTEETDSSRRVAHTARVVPPSPPAGGDSAELYTSTHSAAAREELTSTAFLQFPLWIQQRYACAQPDDSSPLKEELQSVVKLANQTFLERLELGESLSTEDVTGVLGHVNGDGQCLMHTLRIAANSREHARVLRTQFLTTVQQQPDSLLGLSTAADELRNQYGLNLYSPEQISLQTMKLENMNQVVQNCSGQLYGSTSTWCLCRMCLTCHG